MEPWMKEGLTVPRSGIFGWPWFCMTGSSVPLLPILPAYPSPNHLFDSPPTLQNSGLQVTQREELEAPEPPFLWAGSQNSSKDLPGDTVLQGITEEFKHQTDVYLLQWNGFKLLKASLLKVTYFFLWPGQGKYNNQFRTKKVSWALNSLPCCVNTSAPKNTKKTEGGRKFSAALWEGTHPGHAGWGAGWGKVGGQMAQSSSCLLAQTKCAQGGSFLGVKHWLTVRVTAQGQVSGG